MDWGRGTVADEGLITHAMNGWGHDEMIVDVEKAAKTAVKGQDVGAGIYDHYTQIVWASTCGVGCAYAICPKMRFLVCNYKEA